MAATKTTTDNADPITIISKDMTKHILHLEGNVEKLRKLPKPDDILEGMKNELWHKMCKPCRTKLFDSSSKDFSAWKERSSTLHPLEDQEMVEQLKRDNALLRNILKERDKNIKDLEEKMKENTKGVTLTTKGRGNDTKHQTAGTGQVKTRSQTKQDNRNLQDRTNEGISPPEESIRSTGGTKKIKNKRLKKNENIGTEMKEINTERPILKDQTDSLKRINDEVTTAIKTEDQGIGKLTGERDEKQKFYDKIHEEKDECMTEISQLQTQRQTLQDPTDSLKRTIGDLSSMLKTEEQNIDKLKGNLEETQSELDKIQKENENNVTQISQLETEKQKLQDQKDILNKTNEEMTSNIKGQQEEMERLKEKLDEKLNDYDKLQEEKEECMREVSQLQAERQTLLDQIETVNGTVEDLSSTLKTKDQNIDKLTGEREKKQKAYEKLQRVKEESMREVTKLQAERQTLQDQTDSLKRTIKDLLSTLKTKEQNIEKLTGELDEKLNDYDKLQEEKEECMTEIAQLQREKQTLQDHTDSLNRTFEDLSSTIKAKEQDLGKLKGELEETQKELDKIQTVHIIQISQLDQEKQKLLGQKDLLNKTIEEMVTTMETQEKELETLKRHLEDKQFDLENRQGENERYTWNITPYQPGKNEKWCQTDPHDDTTGGIPSSLGSLLQDTKVPVMRLLRTNRSGLGKVMVDMVTKELTRQVGGRLNSRNFSIVPSETSTGVSKGPLFAVCLNSMVGKNVPYALKGSNGGRDVYLLVLHQTTRENVSTLRRTSLRNTGIELRQLGGVIDMVFSSESGLIVCDVNNTAVERIATVLKKY